jgi:hypothetical protein
MGIVKYQRVKTQADFDAYVLAMYLMYCRAPGRKTAPGEAVDLGEIGSAPEIVVRRTTPYSPAEKQI